MFAAAIVIGFFVVAANMLGSDPELYADLPPAIQIPIFLLVAVFFLYANSVFTNPAAYYDPAEHVLVTINKYGAERRWPRYPGEGELAADDGRILFRDQRGKRRTLVNRFEVNPAQFDFVRSAIAVGGGHGEARGSRGNEC